MSYARLMHVIVGGQAPTCLAAVSHLAADFPEQSTCLRNFTWPISDKAQPVGVGLERVPKFYREGLIYYSTWC